ncbi:MAG: glycoside hydrolase domain-containing protein, partial [Spirochaetota bacterium]
PAEGNYILECYSGPRRLEAGKPVYFIFRLLITPFKPFAAHKQWRTRFMHQYAPPVVAKAEGATVLNIHHAKPINPFINYPFLRPAELRSFVSEAHRLGLKVCVYYTVRELSNHAPELFALRSLRSESGSEIFSDGPGGGHSWLQEHFGDSYIPAWHVFEYGCVAVITSGTSRWHNFYVEGIHWLAKNMELDGVYIDDLAFDRRIMQRVRRVLDAERKEAIIDMHSANQYNPRDGYANSINLYMEHLPYLDRLWFGEYFRYDQGPDYWMTEVAGLPFGVGGEMLQDGGNLWRGLLYGITARYPHTKGDPRPLWRLWEDFGIEDSDFLGYWAPSCPVRSNSRHILASCYKRKETALIVLASWEETEFAVQLSIDWQALSWQPERYELFQPFVAGVQEECCYQLADKIPVQAAEGVILILRVRKSIHQ